MDIAEKIKKYIAKGNKSARILDLFMKQKYVTCSDIINYECEDIPIVNTTSPHSIIATLRRNFGYDFIKDEEMKFEAIRYYNGKPYKISDTYKRYFLNLEGVQNELY